MVHHLANHFLISGSQLAVGHVPTMQFVARYGGDLFSTFAVASFPLSQPESRKSETVVIASDDKYGNKQVIYLTPSLCMYLLENVMEQEVLRQLREETSKIPGSQKQVSPDQAQLLAMIVQILGAQRCIEVGVYTGYSSLDIALVLPIGGKLVARERDEESLKVATKYYSLVGVLYKVDVKRGLAAATLKSMIQSGESGSYDFAFIDADKRKYLEYFEWLLKLARVGLIVIDNVLWHGKVADPSVNGGKTVSIRDFNKKLKDDKRVSISMVPIGDGMTIYRKDKD